MQICHTIREFREARAVLTRSGKTLGLVPTMGALHEGHLSLVRSAASECDAVAITIFVNPTQFAPGEDFDRYPRTFEADLALLQSENVALVFAPSPAEMYPPSAPQVIVDIPEIGARLDGASRPGHFRGVATVVSKLFNITTPDRAYFGQKDAAQVAVLRAMVRALDTPVDVRVCPTVRDVDGLALSSRNRYLSALERTQALALPRILESVAERITPGSDLAMLRASLAAKLNAADGFTLDYAAIVHPDTLLPISSLDEGALIAAAVHVGKTRLIDNIVLTPVAREHEELTLTAGAAR
ncbi:pantoate--beta-alanine ligase [Granulicella cerasi]|uniref:Pantothenate synthetase n=2 Tax=Granulicella cerasi TaxID=741063 RepID=A0ABW1Z9V6_9BACT